ncbi:MAG TPA: class I SAM-dependent methyltransferase [Methylomirabilota bacterium]|nr:class I SAM-dependent methyltransferase [Methylomirabilota bacterium]
MKGHGLAWDCACGSGQATVGLAEHFTRVIGTDASASQIACAPKHPKIDWRVAPAELSGLSAESIDLTTVAQAAHWFDLPAFYNEVRRVAKPGSVIALWSYGIQRFDDPALQEIVTDFYSNVVGPYWPPERVLVENGYRTVPFPFEELAAPGFSMSTSWDLEQLLAYFGTWSATNRYREALKQDPLPELRDRLLKTWTSPGEPRLIEWPLAFRVGRL